MNGEICRGYGLNRGSKQTACGNYVNPSTCRRSWNMARNFIISQMRSYLKLLFGIWVTPDSAEGPRYVA